MDQANKIVKQDMYANDAFSKWLGIEIKEIKEGYAHLEMSVRPEMLNGFKIAHGGISYSLADSALAFASNSFGDQAVSIETSISHTKPIFAGDILTAKSRALKEGKKFSIYEITISNQKNVAVALFKGTVYKTGNHW